MPEYPKKIFHFNHRRVIEDICSVNLGARDRLHLKVGMKHEATVTLHVNQLEELLMQAINAGRSWEAHERFQDEMMQKLLDEHHARASKKRPHR